MHISWMQRVCIAFLLMQRFVTLTYSLLLIIQELGSDWDRDVLRNAIRISDGETKFMVMQSVLTDLQLS